MKRRNTVLVLVAISAVMATTIMRCDYSSLAYNSFSFIPREQPRVFISHHPLRAHPGQTITIRLTADLGGAAGSVTGARVRITKSGDAQPTRLTCAAETGGAYACAYTLAGSATNYQYEGDIETSNNIRVSSHAYRFRATDSIGWNEAIALREPIEPNDTLQPSYRVRTAFVRDDGDFYGALAFDRDIERAVYQGILADPVYRWRDTQLAFYEHGAIGMTTSYYSGFDTSCGQNPWPADAALPAGLSSMDVMAVLHHHPNTAGGAEGTVTSTNVFRDCAGHAVRRNGLRTFSAIDGSPLIAKHEFGHAAFGLGDEYAESRETRFVPKATSMSDQECCCMEDPGGLGGVGAGGSGPGGAGGAGLSPRNVRPKCVGDRRPTGLNFPTCSETSPVPVACAATPIEMCPANASNCVVAQMWLGEQAAGATPRGNVFPSQDECNAARAAVLLHPGVEDASTSVEPQCRLLCGGDTPCPCGPAEAWIVDQQPDASAATASGSDTMGTVMASRHGATCAWCVDTSLCVRWERARGQSADDAWSFCQAPPLNAAQNERDYLSFAGWLVNYIDAHLPGWF